MKKEEAQILLLRTDEPEKAFRLLVHIYKEPIYKLLRRILVSHEESQDVMQDVFIKVYKHLSSFRAESGLFTWIYRIAINQALRHIQNMKKNAKAIDMSEKIESNASPDADKTLIEFQKAIANLPKKQGLVFQLRYYEELPYDEIAKITGGSVSSLKTNYHYACEKIKSHLLTHVS